MSVLRQNRFYPFNMHLWHFLCWNNAEYKWKIETWQTRLSVYISESRKLPFFLFSFLSANQKKLTPTIFYIHLISKRGYFIFRNLPSKQRAKVAVVRCTPTIKGLRSSAMITSNTGILNNSCLISFVNATSPLY